MRWLDQIGFYLRSLFQKRKLDEQLSDEIRTHVALATEANVAQGMSPDEARYAALREFGNVAQIQERTREEHGWVWLEQRIMSLRVSVRQLRKAPGFTLVALATLALGIGINTSAFTVLNRLILFSPPFHNASRLVQISSATPGSQRGAIAPADFLDLQRQAVSFSHVAFYAINPGRSVTPPGRPAEQVTAMAVGADFFNTIGVLPFMGRNFTLEEEAQGGTAVIISFSYWQEHFGGDPAIIGHELRFFGRESTIVGVASPILDDPQIWNARIDLWNLDLGDINNRQKRSWGWYSMIGRLHDDATVAAAEVELKTIAARLAHEHPETNRNRGFHAEPYAPDYLGGLGRTLMWMVTALSLIVLLIACLNLANLQLVRTTGRAREFAVRLALGASRRQIIESLLLESLLLSFVGGLLGLVVAKWCNDYYANYFNSPTPLDLRVVTFAIAATTLTGLTFGLLPAWIGTRGDIDVALKQGGRTATSGRSRLRLRQLLIISELVLTVALLVSAGFFVRGIQRIMDRSLHWNPDNVLVGWFELGYFKYGDAPNPRHAIFADKFLAALRQLPGVNQAAFSTAFPAIGPSGWITLLPPDGGAETTNGEVANYDAVTPEFFATYGIPLLRGRLFTAGDRLETPAVVVISASLAEKYWPGRDPLGKRLRSDQGGNGEEIIGVVGDFTYGADFMSRYSPHHFFRAWLQHSNRFPSFNLRTSGDPRLLREKIREVLAGMEPDVAIARLLTAREGLESNWAQIGLVRRTLLYMAILGLLLSMLGIYGLIAHLTAERTQEIGVRLVLGAEPRDVVQLFLRNGLVLACVGTGIGAVLSMGLLRLLRHNLDMVPGGDPGTIAAAATVLFSMALLATWIPARRAAKVDPVIALRTE